MNNIETKDSSITAELQETPSISDQKRRVTFIDEVDGKGETDLIVNHQIKSFKR